MDLLKYQDLESMKRKRCGRLLKWFPLQLGVTELMARHYGHEK